MCVCSGPRTEGLGLQGPHLLRGGREEALQALDDRGEVGNQEFLGSVGCRTRRRVTAQRVTQWNAAERRQDQWTKTENNHDLN